MAEQFELFPDLLPRLIAAPDWTEHEHQRRNPKPKPAAVRITAPQLYVRGAADLQARLQAETGYAELAEAYRRGLAEHVQRLAEALQGAYTVPPGVSATLRDYHQ